MTAPAPLRWFDAIAHCQAGGEPWVLVTIIGTQGSTPRAAGSKMIITAESSFDTLGGGQLEHLIMARAREMITTGENQQTLEHLPLSNKTRQCCGGTVNVLLECFTGAKQHLYLFGAGHVAKALVKILGEIDCRISWVDSRKALFPATLPANTKTFCVDEPVNFIHSMQKGAMALVLTHDHILDYQLISALLDYAECEFIGLIGSKAKAQRFRKRLKSESFSEKAINKLNCPVGLQQIPGKLPMEVAVSIAGQLIQLINPKSNSIEKQKGVYWRDAFEQQTALSELLPQKETV